MRHSAQLAITAELMSARARCRCVPMRERAGPVSNVVTPQSRRGYRPCMATVIKAVSFDAADALAVATFWAGVFGSDVDEDSSPDKAFVEAAGWGGPNIWFIRVPEAKTAKNRMHFCESPRVRWRLRCFGFRNDYSVILAV